MPQNFVFQQWQKSVLKSRKKNPILQYKWLFWWVFNFRFVCEDVKWAKNEVPELLFHIQIVSHK
jgi:hypothetical protein